MFIIAGISPKTITVEPGPVLCPACGLAQARYKRIDHYFSLFFIPLVRVKKGEPFLHCDRCENRTTDPRGTRETLNDRKPMECPYCLRKLKKDFSYCPYCGKAI